MFLMPNPTTEQIETLRDLFLKRFEKENLGKTDDYFHPNDINRIKTSNHWLKLFLQQCDLDMKQSLNMLWDTCLWRKNYGTNDINENNIKMDYLKSGIIYPHNKDIDGKILLIFKSKLHTKGTRDVDELIRCLVYWIERLQKQTNYDQLTIFFDMQSSGLSNMDMDFTKRIIDTFKFYYPNSLNYIVIFDMPWVLSAAFKIIKTLLPPKAVARMKFVNQKTMKEIITEDNMLRSWGGNDDYEFKFEPISTNIITTTEPLRINGITTNSLNINGNNKKVHFANPSPPESPMSTTANGAGEKMGSSVGDEMLRITPDDAIFFQKNGNELAGFVDITNISQDNVTYKVKTTSPEKFRVRPSTGVLAPGTSTSIVVGLQRGQELSSTSKDKFLVMCMKIGDDILKNSQSMADLWKNTTSNNPNVEQHRLKCTLPHTELSNGDNVINGCFNAVNGLGGMDADKQINHFNAKLSQLTEKTEKLQKQIKRTHNLQWLTVLLLLFFSITMLYAFKDELLNGRDREACYKRV